MATWSVFPHLGAYAFTATRLKQNWERLHAGDKERCPEDAEVLRAWMLFHRGEFEQATQVGLRCAGDGVTVANKATAVYANHLEPQDHVRLKLFWQVAQRAQTQSEQEPDNASAWYWQAYALGRYSQGISVTQALAQGLGSRVRQALERTIQLQPHHADAHIALGAFHAEVIDKVGSLIGSMAYGANKEVGMKLYQDALQLNPNCANSMLEYAHALVLMEGEKRLGESTLWLEKAAACQPADAMERLDVQAAMMELQLRRLGSGECAAP